MLGAFLFFASFGEAEETATRGGQLKRMFLKILQTFTGKHLCQSLYFNKVGSNA